MTNGLSNDVASAPATAPVAEARSASVATLFVVPTLLWGSTWYAITFQLGVVAPAASVVYRFALAAALLAAWCAATGRSLAFTARDHLWIAAQGAPMFGLGYVLIYHAEQYIASGPLAVLFATIVFANLAGARIFFGDELTPRAVAGAVLGVGGVALLFLPEFALLQADLRTVRGVAYGLASVLLASAGNMVAVRNSQAGLPLLPVVAWGMGYGAAVAGAAAVLGGAAWTFDARAGYVLSLAYLAVFGSIVAFGTYLTLVARIGAGPASYVGVAIPVIAMIVSTLFESYRWTLPALAGIVLVVTGNLLVLWKPRGRRRPQPVFPATGGLSPGGNRSLRSRRRPS
jgi:drug/metabolite transporter (DMT)-like permease